MDKTRDSRIETKYRQDHYKGTLRKVCAFFAVASIVVLPFYSYAQQTASYYTYQSCLREGTSGIMANGKELKDAGQYTCAIWGIRFGTLLRITNLLNGRWVIVEVTDRGPAKKLVKKGRIIDLNLAAFRKIADCKQGIIPIRIDDIPNGNCGRDVRK